MECLQQKQLLLNIDINCISKPGGGHSLSLSDKMFYPGKKCLYCLMMMMRGERPGEAGLVSVSTLWDTQL